MNRRFAADPLDIPSPACPAPGDRLPEKIGDERLSASRIEGVGFGDAERAAQVAPGEIEQVRRHQLAFFAVFDAVAKDTRRGWRLAVTKLPGGAVYPTAMFAEQTMPVVLMGSRQALGVDRAWGHFRRR